MRSFRGAGGGRMACRASRGALYRGGVAYRQRQLLKFRHSRESGNPGLLGRCRDSPRRARYFLAARQESTQRNAPRLPGLTASGCPRCESCAGPAAKLAGQQTAVVGQRDRNSPANLPRSAGQRGMKTDARFGSGEKQIRSRLV